MKVKPLWTQQFGRRPLYSTIDTIVLHTMYHPEEKNYFCPQACQKWLDFCGVSAHYLIDRQGGVWQTVLEKDMAWHAGVSKMPFVDDNRTEVNQFSLGIELIATEVSGIEDCQYESLTWLVADITKRQAITAIVRHSDIAPGRKTDPWGFDIGRFKAQLSTVGLSSLTCFEMIIHI